MRILFGFAGGSGHLEPLVPIARAAQAAGHTVAFAGRPWMVPKVEQHGFVCYAAGSDRGLTPQPRPLVAYDAALEARRFAEGFGRRNARERAADILTKCAAWQPDLVLWEETDFGALLAAEQSGWPHASVLVTASGAFVRPELVREPLAALRAAYDLPADPDLVMLHRHLVLVPFSPTFRDPAFPLPPTAHAIRPAVLEAAQPGSAPPWPVPEDDRPLVYFTLGTIFNIESGDLIQRVLAGVRTLPIRLLVTVGSDLDPAALGPQPPNVRIERFVPQHLILPHCRAVVSHGGSGTVIGTLAQGLPALLLPMGADQPLNAARCRELGVAQVLDPLTATPAAIRSALSAVLAEPAYRRAAERMRDEMVALPDAAHAVSLLEAVVQGA